MPDEAPPPQLPDIVPPTEAEVAASVGLDDGDKAEKEKDQFDSELAGHAAQAAALRNEHAKAYIDNLNADREMRKTYSSRILKYLEFYSIGVGLLLVAEGFGQRIDFSLDKEVVTALVGSTAVAAIGLVGFIARGLFRSPPEPPPETKG